MGKNDEDIEIKAHFELGVFTHSRLLLFFNELSLFLTS